MSAVDALIEDIRIIRKSLEALHSEVAGLSKRAREQGKHLSRAELDEVLDKVKKETSFSLSFKDVAEKIQPHLATPAKLDATMLGGLQRLEQVISQIPRSVPVENQVWGFTNWKVGALSVGTPLLLLMLLLWFPGVFSRVPKSDFEKLQRQYAYTEKQLVTFRSMRDNLFKQDSLLAYRYFPYNGDPRPPFASKPVSPAPKKKRPKHR